MKLHTLIMRAMACVFVLALGVACTNDFGGAGAGLVDQVNFETNVTTEVNIAAYSMRLPEVQTNRLPTGAIGVYTDAVYGNSTVSALSQVTLSRFTPDFGENPELAGVYFTLPYFSDIEDVDEDGNSTYELDSIFTNTGPMKLSIYRSNYFLNDLDPDSNFEDAALYFSNDIQSFEGVEGDLLYEVEDFRPEADEIRIDSLGTSLAIDSDVEVSERLSPALRVPLDIEYFTENLINQVDSENLINPANFRDFFRGIYIKVEPVNGGGSYILFDYAEANITAWYTFDGDDDSGELGDEEVETQIGTISLNFSGVQLLGIENNFNSTIANNIESADTISGDERLYLKGGNGSVALIDIFPDTDGDGVEDQLDILRSCNVIVNEANLTFFVDQEAIAGSSGVREPERVFIYDFDNNRILIDGLADVSTGNIGPVSARTIHLGRLTREEEGDLNSKGVSYRIRLTRHINDILNNDSTDVRLALAVSQNVLDPNSSRFLENSEVSDERIPSSSVIAQEGTILHGNQSTNEDKQLKLRIYYTLTEEIDPNSPCGQILGLQ